jgi:RNA polymerase primary sigma factor
MQQHRSELSVAIVTLDGTVKDLGLSIDELHSTRIDLLSLTQKAQSIRNRMAMANVLLVFSIANGYQGRGLELDDLVQEGFLGLIKAVERFDHRLGFRFSTYATWWIRQSVTRAIADYARLIRLPVHVIEKFNKFRRLIFELERELGRAPHVTEVTERAQVPYPIVKKYLDFDNLFPSEMPVIDPWDGEASGAFLTEVAQHTLDEEDIFIDQRRRLLRLVIAELPERQAEVIRLRFGLDDGIERTLEQVGVQFGVTRERIRQIEVKALNRLRHPTRVSTISELFNQS